MTARTKVFVGPATAVGLIAFGVGACGPADTGDEVESAGIVAQADAGPNLVRIEDPGLHPEGIEWDEAGGRFLVSSVTRGTVTEVLDDGSYAVFIEDPDIGSSIGIHIDRANGRLLVANSDLASFQGAPGYAKLGAYDLDTGERIFMADLGGLTPGERQFANDIATGPDGTAYVTNYMTPAIYRVTPSGDASVLVSGEPLAPGGINGIEFHPDGFLIAAQAEARGLLRVGLDGAVTRVEVPEPMGVDGLVFLADGRLAAVARTGEGETGQTEVLLLESADGWGSATIVGRWEAASEATTAAVRGGDVYVIDARFADMGGDAPYFDITRVRFE